MAFRAFSTPKKAPDLVKGRQHFELPSGSFRHANMNGSLCSSGVRVWQGTGTARRSWGDSASRGVGASERTPVLSSAPLAAGRLWADSGQTHQRLQRKRLIILTSISNGDVLLFAQGLNISHSFSPPECLLRVPARVPSTLTSVLRSHTSISLTKKTTPQRCEDLQMWGFCVSEAWASCRALCVPRELSTSPHPNNPAGTRALAGTAGSSQHFTPFTSS